MTSSKWNSSFLQGSLTEETSLKGWLHILQEMVNRKLTQWHLWIVSSLSQNVVSGLFPFFNFTFYNSILLYIFFSFYPTCPLHIYYDFQWSVLMGFLSMWTSGSLHLHRFYAFSWALFLLFVLSNANELVFSYLIVCHFCFIISLEACLFSNER